MKRALALHGARAPEDPDRHGDGRQRRRGDEQRERDPRQVAPTGGVATSWHAATLPIEVSKTGCHPIADVAGVE